VTTIDQQLEVARLRAVALADRRVRAMQRRLHDQGADDRRILGITDPVTPRPIIREAAGFGALAAAFQTFIEDFTRSFNAGWNAIRPEDRR